MNHGYLIAETGIWRVMAEDFEIGKDCTVVWETECCPGIGFCCYYGFCCYSPEHHLYVMLG